MNDIKVPPFTKGQQELIKMTEKLANGRKICDVDDIDDDIKDIKITRRNTMNLIQGEHFEVTSVVYEEGNYYYFSETELLEHVEGRTPDYVQYMVLADLIYGDKKVVKLPFEPKEGNPYWVATWDPNENTLTTCKVPWHNRADCWADKYCGNVFRTEKEAEAHKYEIYEKLTGKKWGGEQ